MSRKKLRTVALTAFALAAALVLVGCTPVVPTPVPPGNVTVIVNVGNTPTPGGSPGTGGGSGQQVFGAKIGEFGERTTSQCNDTAEDFPRETRVGCISDVTCSPTDASGREIKSGNPSQLVYFKQLGGTGAGTFVQGDEPYNGTISCRTTGVVVLECSLRDTATGTIVTGGNSGAQEDSPWTTSCVG